MCGGRQNKITPSLAALWITLGSKCDECPSTRRRRGRTGGACDRTWRANQSSNKSPSIHPFFDSPYTVPGTSPTVSSGFSDILSKITNGGRAYPAALQHAKTVTCVLSPDPTADGFFCPHFATTRGGEGSSGIPVSSRLKI